MILQFVTPRTRCGNRKYLYIDTGAEEYTTQELWNGTHGIEIKARDYRELIDKLDRSGYRERIRL